MARTKRLYVPAGDGPSFVSNSSRFKTERKSYTKAAYCRDGGGWSVVGLKSKGESIFP